jgi:hypothetical protein
MLNQETSYLDSKKVYDKRGNRLTGFVGRSLRTYTYESALKAF